MTHDSRTWWILGPASLASLMVALDTLVVSTALSTIRLDSSVPLEQLEWTVNAYNLSLAVPHHRRWAGRPVRRRRLFVGPGPVRGRLRGLRPVRLGGSADRGPHGAGRVPLVLTLALTLVSAAFPPARRGAAIGSILQGVVGVGQACGPLVGGAIAEGLAWEWILGQRAAGPDHHPAGPDPHGRVPRP